MLIMGVNRKLFENARQHIWLKMGLDVLVRKIIASASAASRTQSKRLLFYFLLDARQANLLTKIFI